MMKNHTVKLTIMTPQPSSPASQQPTPAQPTQSRAPIRTSADWEKPAIEFLDLCLEVTAYVQHWQ
jgi:coenzyme PQQ precursor peptide PqqA